MKRIDHGPPHTDVLGVIEDLKQAGVTRIDALDLRFQTLQAQQEMNKDRRRLSRIWLNMFKEEELDDE